MPDWSIMIIRSTKPGVAAELQPDIDDAEPGDSLEVEQGDAVSWNNTTDQEYWPVPTKTDPPNANPPGPAQLTAKAIQPHSSSPNFNVTQSAGTTIHYSLKSHPEVQGSLVVVPFGHVSSKVVA